MKSPVVRVPVFVLAMASVAACGPSSEEPALPDGGAVSDAGKPGLLDPARFRAAAQCADCDVLNVARLNLPATGVGAASAKMRAPDGRFFELTLRDSDDRAEESALLADERRALQAKFGKLQPELHAWTRSAAYDDRTWVWMWASVPDYDVPREKLLTDPVFAAAHEDRVKADLAAALGPIRDKLKSLGVEIVESGGPSLRARLSADEVRALESIPQIARIGTDSYPGKGTSAPWSIASQWHPTMRLDLAQFVSTGVGTRVCVKEDSRPDDTSLLSIVATANPYGPTNWHARGMAGIVRNTVPPVSSYSYRSVAPGASVYLGNWLGYGGSVDEWCRSQSTTIMTFAYDTSVGTSLTNTDWVHDWLAKNSPHMLVVTSAGAISGAADTVANRAFDGLVVGAIDDHNTSDRSDDTVMPTSAWRNPTTAHGDLELPNLVAPGNGFAMGASEFSGTSVASVMAAGVSALLTAPDLSGWPEAKRAVMMATAIGRADQGLITSLSSAGDTKIGAGEIDAYWAATLGDSSYNVGSNAIARMGRTGMSVNFASSFGSDAYLTTRWKAHADFNGRMRVVIAWDATATCPSGLAGYCTGDTPDADFDLHLYKKTDSTWTMTGTMACSSARWDSTWELCDFPVLAGEDYLIGVRKYGTSGASTYLGVAWLNYIQPAGQPCSSATECSNGCISGRCGCVADFECGDRFCNAGVCTSRVSNGLGCSRPEQCTSGNCVDGVCCDTTCTGSCMACSALKKGTYPDGTCGPISNNTDPDSECPGQSCTGNTLTRAYKCNGAGACASPGTASCGPYQCAGSACRVMCSADTDCANGYYCLGNSCVPKKAGGAACTTARECSYGFCVDGVCCDEECDGTCQACSAAKKGSGPDGVCWYIDNGRNPDNECLGASCAAGVVTNPQVCNGSGACRANGTTSCNGYMCSGPSCGTTCSSDSGCVSTHYCASGTCTPKKTNGVACSAGNQCNSASCVDGVCCDTACTGTCMACSAAKKGSGADGTCAPIADGRPPTTGCAGASCTAGTVTLAQVCNGAGACRANGTSSCAGYGCSGAACAAACSPSVACAPTHYCSGSACLVKKTNGATCADTSECASGNCVDGVCCNTGCGAACQACNVPGSVGTCTGTDEAGCAPICGTGVRNLAEECDDGLGTATTPRRPCSSTCSIVDLPVAPSTSASPARTLGKGRHPIAIGTSGHGIVYVEDAKSTALIALATFDSSGNAQDPPKVVKSGAAFESNPVVAAIPGNQYVVAYTDIGGDGDSLGVLLQKVDPVSGALGAAVTANQTTSFSQYDADLIWTGSELVAAWVDTSSFTTGADLKLRRFNASLAPLAAEEPLATTTATESDLALVPYAGTWAAAWRAAESGTERIVVRTGTTTWSIDVTAPAPAGVRPSIVPLDTTHLFVVFAEDAPAHLRGAVIDTTTTGGGVSSFAVQSASTTTPVVARVGSRLFLAWTRESGAPTADDAFFQEITWTGTAVDFTSTVRPLPRVVAHRDGDQRFPALAGTSALITAWEDYSASLGAPRTAVATQWVPLPLFRSSP